MARLVTQGSIAHYNDDPGSGGPILLLCSDGPAMSSLEWDDDSAQELRDELEQVGVFLEMDDRVTAGYYFVDDTSDLRKRQGKNSRQDIYFSAAGSVVVTATIVAQG